MAVSPCCGAVLAVCWAVFIVRWARLMVFFVLMPVSFAIAWAGCFAVFTESSACRGTCVEFEVLIRDGWSDGTARSLICRFRSACFLARPDLSPHKGLWYPLGALCRLGGWTLRHALMLRMALVF